MVQKMNISMTQTGMAYMWETIEQTAMMPYRYAMTDGKLKIGKRR